MSGTDVAAGPEERRTNANPPSAQVAVIAAADEELRVLLRGLLQLHRVRVDGEAEGATEAGRLVRERRPTLLVADVHLLEGSAAELIRSARAVLPQIRIVLVVPANRPGPEPGDVQGTDAVLPRPFRIRQFAEAILSSAERRPAP